MSLIFAKATIQKARHWPLNFRQHRDNDELFRFRLVKVVIAPHTVV
jgi:hypothetical protein